MIIRQLAFALAVAVLTLAVAAGLRYGQTSGLLEAETAKRAMQVLIGLGLAAYANFMPKQGSGGRGSQQAQMRTQAALRVGGWSMALGGLAYAALWAFAPLAVADTGSMVVILAAMAATVGYALWSFTACRNARTSH